MCLSRAKTEERRQNLQSFAEHRKRQIAVRFPDLRAQRSGEGEDLHSKSEEFFRKLGQEAVQQLSERSGKQQQNRFRLRSIVYVQHMPPEVAKKLNLTSEFNEVAVGNLGKMRAEHFSVKFLLIAPSRRRERSVVEERSDEEVEKMVYQVRSTINKKY